MKPTIILPILLTLLFLGCRNAPSANDTTGQLIEASAASAGMSAERLDKIEAMLQDAVNTDEIPGAVALIARKGKIVFHKSFGMADNASQKEMTRDAILLIPKRRSSAYL